MKFDNSLLYYSGKRKFFTCVYIYNEQGFFCVCECVCFYSAFLLERKKIILNFWNNNGHPRLYLLRRPYIFGHWHHLGRLIHFRSHPAAAVFCHTLYKVSSSLSFDSPSSSVFHRWRCLLQITSSKPSPYFFFCLPINLPQVGQTWVCPEHDQAVLSLTLVGEVFSVSRTEVSAL